jgi:hypothetical protein
MHLRDTQLQKIPIVCFPMRSALEDPFIVALTLDRTINIIDQRVLLEALW